MNNVGFFNVGPSQHCGYVEYDYEEFLKEEVLHEDTSLDQPNTCPSLEVSPNLSIIEIDNNQMKIDEDPRNNGQDNSTLDNIDIQFNENDRTLIINEGQNETKNQTKLDSFEKLEVKLKSETLDISNNIAETPHPINNKLVITKIPVILAQLMIPLEVISRIKLPNNTKKIRHTEKSISLTECSLIQPTNILFLKGVIRRSIEFSTKHNPFSKDSPARIQVLTADSPFKCSTALSFLTPPKVMPPSTRPTNIMCKC